MKVYDPTTNKRGQSRIRTLQEDKRLGNGDPIHLGQRYLLRWLDNEQQQNAGPRRVDHEERKEEERTDKEKIAAMTYQFLDPASDSSDQHGRKSKNGESK